MELGLVRFSSEKSKVMIVNRSEDESNATWRIGVNELNQVLEYKYLGMSISPNRCEKAKNEKISLANQWVGRLGLNAPRYTAVEALRGDMDWSTFRERLIKSTLRY